MAVAEMCLFNNQKKWHHVSLKALSQILQHYHFPSELAQEMWTFLPKRECTGQYFMEIAQTVETSIHVASGAAQTDMPFLDIIMNTEIETEIYLSNLILPYLPEWQERDLELRDLQSPDIYEQATDGVAKRIRGRCPRNYSQVYNKRKWIVDLSRNQRCLNIEHNNSWVKRIRVHVSLESLLFQLQCFDRALPTPPNLSLDYLSND